MAHNEHNGTRANLWLGLMTFIIAAATSLLTAGVLYGSLAERVKRSEQDIQVLQQEVRDELKAMRSDFREMDRKLTRVQTVVEGKR